MCSLTVVDVPVAWSGPAVNVDVNRRTLRHD